MEYEEFIATVAHEAEVDREQAERAARATLDTLGERISSGQAQDLARQLPPELRPLLERTDRAQPFGVDEFLARVAEREGTSPDRARDHARAVFATLGAAVSQKEIEDVAAELPKDFTSLIREAEAGPSRIPSPPREPMRFGDFIRRVCRRFGRPRDEAVKTTEAVLETLAERISGGEVDDLAARLPTPLKSPLVRGKAESHGAARPLSLDQFLTRVAERSGLTPAQAKEGSRAVFATLREAVGEKELSDVEAQLPRDYASLLARP